MMTMMTVMTIMMMTTITCLRVLHNNDDDDDDDKDYGGDLHLFEVRSQCGSLRLGKRRDCEALLRIGGSGQLENMTRMMI